MMMTLMMLIACGSRRGGVQVPLSVVVDVLTYGRPLWSVFNLVFYNVLNRNAGGSELYGVEPWYGGGGVVACAGGWRVG